MNGELKPCPFCGGNDLIIFPDRNVEGTIFSYHVHCRDCLCNGRNHNKIGWCETEAEAVEAWNTRASQTTISKVAAERIKTEYQYADCKEDFFGAIDDMTEGDEE